MKPTTMSIALTVRNAITNNDMSNLPMKKMVEHYNILAEHVGGAKKVEKFRSKAIGLKKLQSMVGAVEVRGGINFKGDPDCKPEKIKGKRRVGVAGKKGRVSCQVRLDGGAPALVSQVKVSSFKAANEITLSREPSEPQRKYLVEMGVWEKVTING